MIERTMHVLAVPDLEISAAWYRDKLGFEIQEMGDPGWRMLILGNCRMMVGDCPDALSPSDLGDHSYFAYLVTDDAESFFNVVTSRGVELIKPLRDEPWHMREFGVRTIDGHRIMIGEALD